MMKMTIPVASNFISVHKIYLTAYTSSGTHKKIWQKKISEMSLPYQGLDEREQHSRYKLQHSPMLTVFPPLAAFSRNQATSFECAEVPFKRGKEDE